MKAQGIKYKDTLAMPGSDLYKLLEEAQQKPDKAAELRKKAEKCYQECEERYKRSMGQ